MKSIGALSVVCVLFVTLFCGVAPAADKSVLLINLISYTTPEARKAIDQAKIELSRGRTVVVFLNDRSVLVAARNNADQFKEQQQNLNELMKKGATVLVCPHCLKLYGVSESSLLTGIRIAEESHQP